MTGVVITTTDVKVRVDFNAYSAAMGFSKSMWTKNKFSSVMLTHGETAVKVRAVTGQADWAFDQAGVNGAIVESIDGESMIGKTNLELFQAIDDAL